MTLANTELREAGGGSALETGSDPFELAGDGPPADAKESSVHILRDGVRCDTERKGEEVPRGRSPLEIVLDASEGFIPLWAKGTVLRWRFRERSLRHFRNPLAAKAAIERLLADAIVAWGPAAPVRFTQSDSAWDFEIVVRSADNCDATGCVLASAFFPDGGRHELVIYPKMFTQARAEQVETMVHEIGHIFGLRHFFALVKETAWPAEVFGEHNPFSIMNYGAASQLRPADKADLSRLYQLAWSRQLPEINGTPIRFVRPFHSSGTRPQALAALECEPAAG